LVVSVLDFDRKLPIIRYNTKDIVRLVDYEDYVAILQAHGLAKLTPPYRLPVGIIWGKDEGLTDGDGRVVRVAEVKEALYADLDLAAKVTGNFRLLPEGNEIALLVQARPSIDPIASLQEALSARMVAFCGALRVRVIPYNDFRHGMEPDYERKQHYVCGTANGAAGARGSPCRG
jgi:hypothetical protein